SPDMNVIITDSSQTKIAYSRLGQLVTLQYDLKKKEPKGTYRLSGLINDKDEWTGKGQMPDGSWVSWSMKMDSTYVPKPKADSSKKDAQMGAVSYPFLAYGWTTKPQQKTVLFKNATVWTSEAEGKLQNTDVLISNGKIQKIGKGLSDPNAEVVDASNKHLSAGIIDEHSHIAVTGNVNEGTQASSAEVRIVDVIDADDIQIYRQLAGGV